MRDESEATLPYRRINLGNLVAHMAAATGSGLADSNGQLSLIDDGITEPKLSVTNVPTTGQFLTAAASGMFTWVNVPVTAPVRGTRRQWFVADAQVMGAGNNITLNPQDAALTALQDGDTFVFRPNDNIGTSNSVNVLIRQTSPAKTVQRSNGAGGFTNVVIGDWTTGDLVVLQYSVGLDRLVWLGGMTGTASTRNTGTASGEVAVLNSGATFDSALLGGNGAASRVLTYGATGASWQDLPTGGIGTITGITTAAGSGLTGGAITGTPSLSLNIGNLAALTTSTIDTLDEFVLEDVSEASDPVPEDEPRKPGGAYRRGHRQRPHFRRWSDESRGRGHLRSEAERYQRSDHRPVLDSSRQRDVHLGRRSDRRRLG